MLWRFARHSSPKNYPNIRWYTSSDDGWRIVVELSEGWVRLCRRGPFMWEPGEVMPSVKDAMRAASKKAGVE